MKTTKPIFLLLYLFVCIVSCNCNSLEFSREEFVRIDSYIDHDEVVEKQQLLLTVTIFHKVPLIDPELPPPVIDNALVIQAGKVEQGRVDTENFIRIRWAIFPLKSGHLTIPPLLLNTKYNLKENININHKILNHRQFYTQQYQIKVKKIPIDGIPLKQLQLDHQLMRQEKHIINSILQYHLVIQGTNLPAQFLPIPEIRSNSQLESYIEHVESTNIASDQGIVGKHSITYHIKLIKEGRLQIPTISLPWYNTQTSQQEVESSPEVALDVLSNQLNDSQVFSISNDQLSLLVIIAIIVAYIAFKIKKRNSQTKQELILWKKFKTALQKNDLKRARVCFCHWIAYHKDCTKRNQKLMKMFHGILLTIDFYIYSECKKFKRANIDLIYKKSLMLRKHCYKMHCSKKKGINISQAFLTKRL